MNVSGAMEKPPTGIYKFKTERSAIQNPSKIGVGQIKRNYLGKMIYAMLFHLVLVLMIMQRLRRNYMDKTGVKNMVSKALF